jgi:hypothetical protein
MTPRQDSTWQAVVDPFDDVVQQRRINAGDERAPGSRQ